MAPALGFMGRHTPFADLQLHPPTEREKGWASWVTSTRVREPGCYAYQVDGTSFSEVIVFEAVAIKLVRARTR